MSKCVKTLARFTIGLFSLTTSYAQSQASHSPGIVSDLKRVVADYPNRFHNITGELIIENPQSADYRCSFKVKDAEECFITRYPAGKKEICSWQVLMLTTEDFDLAAKKFRSLYGQMNNCSINSSRLQGNYDVPVEEKKFNSVVFSFDTSDESLEKLKIELVMENELLEWKVKIIIYEREKEDDERGRVVED